MLNIELNIDGTKVSFTGKKDISISIKNGNTAVAEAKKEKPKAIIANTKEELLAYIREHKTTTGVKVGKDIKELDNLFEEFKTQPHGFFRGILTWNLSHIESMKNFAKDCEHFSVPIHNLRVRSTCDFTHFIEGTNVNTESIAKFLIKLEKLKEKHEDTTEIGNIGKPKTGSRLEPMNPVISQDAIKEVEG